MGAGTLNHVDDGEETSGVTPLRYDDDSQGNRRERSAIDVDIYTHSYRAHYLLSLSLSLYCLAGQKKKKKTMAVRQLLVYRKSTATLVEESVS